MLRRRSDVNCMPIWPLLLLVATRLSAVHVVGPALRSPPNDGPYRTLSESTGARLVPMRHDAGTPDGAKAIPVR
jgi:hypothetical protein